MSPAAQLNAQLNSNMVANANASASAHGGQMHADQMRALLTAPLSPRVAQAMRAHEAAKAGDPLAFGTTTSQMYPELSSPSASQQRQRHHAAHHQQHQQPQSQPQFQPHFVTHAPSSQLALPLEFVQQQQLKLLAQQLQQQQQQRSGTQSARAAGPYDIEFEALCSPPAPPSPAVLTPIRPRRRRGRSRHGRSKSTPSGQQPNSGGGGGGGGLDLGSPLSSASSASSAAAAASALAATSAAPHYVAARVADLGYHNSKRRGDQLVALLAHNALHHQGRAQAVQLEMRGSVRFDTSNPVAIFESLRAQASRPLPGYIKDFSQKRLVRLRDGSFATVFGAVHSRPHTVKSAALSQFFVQKEEAAAAPSLEKFASSNFAKDALVNAREQRRAEKHNKDARSFERQARVERSEEVLLQCHDDVLSPLETWKRDQLRAKLAKAEQAQAVARATAKAQNEALKLRQERERFEREEREQRDKEQARAAAKEEEERQAREAERLRVYREILAAQAESNKAAREAQEAAREAAEEQETRRLRAEEARRKHRLTAAATEGYTPSFMLPLGVKPASSAGAASSASSASTASPNSFAVHAARRATFNLHTDSAANGNGNTLTSPGTPARSSRSPTPSASAAAQLEDDEANGHSNGSGSSKDRRRTRSGPNGRRRTLKRGTEAAEAGGAATSPPRPSNARGSGATPRSGSPTGSGNGTPSRATSRAQSRRDSFSGDGDQRPTGLDGSPAGGGGGEPHVHVMYVNAKIIAIDQARQAMLVQQGDFEARIKALTTFGSSSSSPPSSSSSKSASTSLTSPTAAAPRKTGASRKSMAMANPSANSPQHKDSPTATATATVTITIPSRNKSTAPPEQPAAGDSSSPAENGPH